MRRINIKKFVRLCVALGLALAMPETVNAKDFEPKYIGGYPTKETATAMFEEYDYQAAVQFYVWGYAYLNTLGMSKGYELMGGNERSMYIFDKLIQPQHVVMTANTNVIYNWSRLIDTGKGPVVVEAPAGSRGSIYDAGSRGVTDTGDIGPDQGKGGKYLVLSPDDRSSVPNGYHVVRLKYSNLFTVIIRTFPGDDGGVEAAVEKGKQIKWYYLSEAAAPPPNIPVLIGDRAYSQDWPRDERAFEWLAELFNNDRVPESAKAHMGNMRRLGLVKGQLFNPDQRAQRILKRAARTAEAMVLSMAYRNRQGRKIYPDRQYESITTNVSPSFFPGPFEEVEQRAGGWHQLVSNVSRYTRPDKPGTGAFYMNTYRDKDGSQLLGQNTYRLRMPVEVPVTQFWQIPVYDVATRALINTDQKRGTLSGSDQLRKNADGSIDLYFGPEAPAGYESNWIKTIPGKGWFILPRLYGPLTPIWDRSWKLDDVELVKAAKDQPQSTGAIPEFIGGYPTKETAEAMFDEYDYQAAVQFYVWGYAYLNNLGMEKGLAKMGGDERSFYHWDKRIQPKDILMTANTEVIYNWSRFIDLAKGPVVFEVPPRVRGHFYDMGVRAYADIGDVGPDKGKGGKYLIVSADYKGKIPEGYFEVRSKYSDRITLGFRSFPAAEGSDAAAVELGKTAKWYYLSEVANPPANSHILMGDRPFSQEWPRDEEAFAWYSEIFNMDKVPASGLAHMGNMRRLGIEKGKSFAPDARAKKILERAAKTAEAMVLSMAFRNRQDKAIYDNREYEPIFLNSSSTFFPANFEEVEVRAGGWHQLVGNFAQYIPAKPGTGGFYSVAYRDKDGESLIGSNTYRLRVPAKVPVKQFWQFPVYEVATRSLMDTDQHKSTLSGNDDLRRNDDGSVDLYFGPKAPKGFEKNWIKTKPGEGWFTLPRLYAPLEPILNKTWRWNDIEKIK